MIHFVGTWNILYLLITNQAVVRVEKVREFKDIVTFPSCQVDPSSYDKATDAAYDRPATVLCLALILLL